MCCLKRVVSKKQNIGKENTLYTAYIFKPLFRTFLSFLRSSHPGCSIKNYFKNIFQNQQPNFRTRFYEDNGFIADVSLR